MEEVILDDITFDINFESLFNKISIKKDSKQAEDVKQMAEEAMEIANLKGMYRIAYIDERGEDYVVIDGIKLTSRVLQVNLDSVQRVFPYVATCGTELEEWSLQYDEDILKGYWADVIKEMAFRTARKNLEAHMSQKNPGPTSSMNPGSLRDWPIKEQQKLFQLLGNVKDKIGVELSDSFLMSPVKSGSGIWFPTETKFENCQLCPRSDCPSRKAPYDENLYEKRYEKE